jgi:hypothetical protein
MLHKLSTTETQAALKQMNKVKYPLAHYRIAVLKNEPYQLPAGTREVQVLSGGARLTIRERDHLLARGESWALQTGETALVNTSDAPLVLDMGISRASAEQERMKREFYERMAQRQQVIEAEDQRKP